MKPSTCFIIGKRSFASALYITGDKAQSHYVVLRPHIDFDEQIKNKNIMHQNIKARQLNLDLDKIQKRWEFFKTIEDHKLILETTRSEIAKLVARIKEDQYGSQSDLDKLLLHLKTVKDDLRNIKEYSYDIEENACLAVLSLPNLLHPKTPLQPDLASLVHSFLPQPNHEYGSHSNIGRSRQLIEYTNPFNCYLKSDAALFEFSVTNYVQSELIGWQYVPFSNADFSRSVIIEGCGVDFNDSTQVFTLAQSHHNDKTNEIDRLHLVGGASLHSFMSYFARHAIQKNYLPLHLFTNGRCYQPTITNDDDLINSAQHSVVQLFIVLPEDDGEICDETFTNVTQRLIKIYENFRCQFRFVYEPANRLKLSESLKLSIQMYSNYRKTYIEVGNISMYDNYLSKRLLVTYLDEKQRKFPKIISGQVLNIQKLLACILENNNAPLVSDVFKKYL